MKANNPNPSISCSLVHIVVYFFLATMMCFSTSSNFTGMDDSGYIFMDVLYFVVVTTLSVGYGDIHPRMTGSKLFTCLLVVLGHHILQSYIWGKLKAKFPHNLSELQRKIITGILALGAVLISIFGGMWGIYSLENGIIVNKKDYKLINATDSFYLSMMSLSTEGFGDFSFKTVRGRVFAV
ncbi:putative Two pore domain potassium channel [Rosa chinensis]|uniref:Putative Two pore domain potassium channel n=1 Tax=Rosa chinensis TaxID=74649 RepID=A0A2P6SCP0_ROSCH|nr:putative Two pore domain potassium channel [Rosa chinensis]